MRDLYRFTKIYVIAIPLFFIANSYAFAQLPNESIKIGFLIRDINDIAIRQTAELAIEHTNANGGYKGRKFELITKSCDGPWGITSKQTVDLIFEDQAPIVVTALDGRNAHLAEQVTAKSHVVMLSTLSSDPTLSRAYVPWYFRMVPDDRQQAEVLAEEIYINIKAKKVVVISFDNYDGKMSAESLVKKIKEKGFPEPEKFIGLEEQDMLEQVTNNLWDAMVLAGSPSYGSNIIEKIISANSNAKMYAFLNPFNFMNEYDAKIFNGLLSVSSFNPESPKWLNFEISYQNKYGKNPSLLLAFVYDGIILSLEAIKKYGPDSEAIRKGFKDLKYEGITGKVEFDGLGNRNKDWKMSK